MSRRASLSLLLAGGLLAGGCVSGSDIEALRAQIAELQRQVVQLQMQSSSKQEIEQLQATIERQTEGLMRAEADMRVDLGNLSTQIEELQGKLDDTNYRLGQVSQQIAATSQDLKAVRSATSPPVAGPFPAPGAGAADPETLYQTSYSDYLRGNYDLALVLLPAAEVRGGDRRVRQGARALSTQRQDGECPAQEGIRPARAGAQAGGYRPARARGAALPLFGRGESGASAPAEPRR